MPTVESSIESALLVRAAALVADEGPLEGLPIAWPNVAFNRPTTAFLRVTHVPNRSRRMFLRGSDPHQRLGLLQIDVFAPKNKGATPATEMAGLVAAHFPADLDLVSGSVKVRVIKAPDVAQAMADDTHWQVPVMVEYEALA